MLPHPRISALLVSLCRVLGGYSRSLLGPPGRLETLEQNQDAVVLGRSEYGAYVDLSPKAREHSPLKREMAAYTVCAASQCSDELAARARAAVFFRIDAVEVLVYRVYEVDSHAKEDWFVGSGPDELPSSVTSDCGEKIVIASVFDSPATEGPDEQELDMADRIVIGTLQLSEDLDSGVVGIAG